VIVRCIRVQPPRVTIREDRARNEEVRIGWLRNRIGTRKALKARTHDKPTSKRVRGSCGQRTFRGGFSVCLILVVLSVLGWVMHRRLSQYDAPRQAIHQSAAIKVCLTERNQISVPMTHGFGAFAALFLAFAPSTTLHSPENSEASVAFRVQREQSDQRADAVDRPSLDHFLFLPPPSQKSVL
jgi:hypothetical protein